MTTIDDLARIIRATYDLDTLDAARDVIRVHVDQIADDPDLWDADADALTPDGVELVSGAIAASYAGGHHSTAAQQLLTDIEDAVAAIAAHTARRDELIRAALRTELPRGDIAAAAKLKPARLYQIRDGRR